MQEKKTEERTSEFETKRIKDENMKKDTKINKK